MIRYLCWVAVLGVFTLPDWASACWPRWAARHNSYVEPGSASTASSYPVYPAYPLYTQPVYVYPPVAIQPVTQPMAPPRVEAVPKAAPSPGVGAKPREQQPSPVQPAGATDTATVPMPMPMTPAAPVPSTPKKADPVATVPAPKNTEPAAKAPEPVAKTPEPAAKTPEPLPKFPVVQIPVDLGPLPKLDVPKEPNFQAIPAPKDTPKPATPTPAPAPAAVVQPETKGSELATPSAAPPLPEGLIPSPSVPVLPDASKPLPSLTLPPELPVAPPKGSVSRSSPLANKSEMTVSVFPAHAGRGEMLVDGYRTVGFYNHTNRDMNLTIEGRVVRLPAKMYLHAKLAPTFTWSHGDNSVVRESVPEGASGVDVVFRD